MIFFSSHSTDWNAPLHRNAVFFVTILAHATNARIRAGGGLFPGFGKWGDPEAWVGGGEGADKTLTGGALEEALVVG